ncbi:MAG: hypothetical protein ACD_21C00031G0004 [uncultured bacterium]|nr:MAG: hypothetical protein ACD_21C00031G0004 [uncultured bacterium]
MKLLQQIEWKKIFWNPWFVVILIAKLLAGSWFASDYLAKGFIPFVEYFVTSGFANPYTFFMQQQQLDAFPYPPIMLALLTLGRLLFWPLGELLTLRIPLLAADLVLYIILCKWLQTKERAVLWLYWASPILFFITYIHGQLDVLPTAMVFVSLIFLFNKKPHWAAMVLGLGIATKTHLLVVVPFYAMYWLVNRYPWYKALAWSIVPLIVAVMSMTPYLWTEGFQAMVFGTSESGKAFLVHLPYLHDNLKLLLAPAALVILFLNFLPYKKLNKDAFMLILGLVFTVFILFVPPMPGWYFWSVPFFVYFFVKYQEIPKLSFWCLTAAYLLYVGLTTFGVADSSLVNIIFTVLIAAVVMNAVWIYRMGVRSNLEYKVHDRPLVIGIGGDSGAGKNTLAQVLRNLFNPRQAMVMEGDDAHKWERQDSHWTKQTHLNPKSNKLYQELQHATDLTRGQAVQRQSYDHHTGRFQLTHSIEPNKVMIYVGLHPFYLSKMRTMFDLKIYVEPDEALRRHWKLVRDHAERGRSKDDVLKQMAERQEDGEKYIKPQRNFADIIVNLFLTEPVQDDKEPHLGLRIVSDNSIHIDPLLEALAAGDQLAIEHWYDDDLHHQTLQCKGKISAQVIQAAAYSIIPNLEELTDYRPVWHADYYGLLQLFILYCYSEQQKSQL